MGRPKKEPVERYEIVICDGCADPYKRLVRKIQYIVGKKRNVCQFCKGRMFEKGFLKIKV